jgi:hypothetical protein
LRGSCQGVANIPSPITRVDWRIISPRSIDAPISPLPLSAASRATTVSGRHVASGDRMREYVNGSETLDNASIKRSANINRPTRPVNSCARAVGSDSPRPLFSIL